MGFNSIFEFEFLPIRVFFHLVQHAGTLKRKHVWMSVSKQRRRKMKKDSFSGFAHDLKIQSATSFQNLSTHVPSMFQTKTWTTHCQPSEAQNGQKLRGTSWPLVFDLFGRSRVSESSICNERKIQQKKPPKYFGVHILKILTTPTKNSRPSTKIPLWSLQNASFLVDMSWKLITQRRDQLWRVRPFSFSAGEPGQRAEFVDWVASGFLGEPLLGCFFVQRSWCRNGDAVGWWLDVFKSFFDAVIKNEWVGDENRWNLNERRFWDISSCNVGKHRHCKDHWCLPTLFAHIW